MGIHRRLIEAFGGAAGVRDLGMIGSALLRPQTGYYSDLIQEAAALCESLAMNHGLVDGNKRVAYACLEICLTMNGIDISADNDSIEAFIYTNLEGGTFNKDVLDAWLRANTVTRA